MKLTLEQIRAIAKGAARVERSNNGIRLLRFTKEQEELYRLTNQDFYTKTFATAGVRLEFTTDSPTLSMEVEVFSGSSRKFFSHEIYVNGTLVGELGSRETNCGRFAGSYELGKGEKHVHVYFPWSTASTLISLELADGSALEPVTKPCNMLIYGDSITHGYDALSPSHSYASLLTDILNAEAFNKGIGGDTFFPALAELSDEVEPDYITVAYGTNDWSKKEKEVFEKTCYDFYEALSRRNPNAKIFAITPIWRADHERQTKVGNFSYVDEYITRAVESLPNVTVIHGIDFVPKSAEYFSDKYLHPNDTGFAHYFENLYSEIKKHL